MAGFLEAASTTDPDQATGPLKTLSRLDRLLERALAAAIDASSGGGAADPYRGLYVRPDDAAALLARGPFGSPLAPVLPAGRLEPEWGELADLGRVFGLSELDLDLLVFAAAPEFDLRYERLFGFLQDDVTRRRPTVDLALELLSRSHDEKLARLDRVSPAAPLLRHRLLRVVPDPHHVEPPFLAHYLVPEDGVLDALLGRPRLHRRIASCARLMEVRAGSGEEGGGGAAIAYLQGPDSCGQEEVVESRAAAVGRRLLVVQLAGLAADPHAIELVLRDARLLNALLYLKDLDALEEEALDVLLDRVDSHDGPLVVAGEAEWPAHRGPRGVKTRRFTRPAFDDRRAAWRAELGKAGVRVAPADLGELAGRFRLTYRQIEYAAAGLPSDPSIDDLFAVARAQAGTALGRLARRIEPTFGWVDLVLPDDQLSQLRELCDRVRCRPVVQERWGFERKLSLARGVSVLFAGPSGTGKTMAAEVVAGELGLHLFKIDLSSVVSKYIGETEKNLARIFKASEETDAILFFDEADALFGKRSEVRDSHDRYANVEISYLLQRMEEHEGVAILATNLRKNLDESFARRLQVVIEFSLPDEELRRRIWQSIWPSETPLDASVDAPDLAGRFELSGGSIRNVALAAASFAAARGGSVGMADVLRGARREYQKLGTMIEAGVFSGERGARA